MTGGGHLPAAAVNMVGGIPVIFAASIMAFPPTRGPAHQQPLGPGPRDLLHSQGWPTWWASRSSSSSSPTSTRRSPSTRSTRPTTSRSTEGSSRGETGRPTAEFLDRILARLTFPGALFLAAVAALPTILINQTSANFFFGGTSILIVIGVALDTVKQLEAQLMMRNYEGFLK